MDLPTLHRSPVLVARNWWQPRSWRLSASKLIDGRASDALAVQRLIAESIAKKGGNTLLSCAGYLSPDIIAGFREQASR